jgi:hypothetical protein
MCHYTGIIDDIFIYRKSVWQFYRTPVGCEIELKAKQIMANHKIKVPNIPHTEHACSTLLIPAIA